MVLIGPWYTMVPIYGSGCLSVRPSQTLVRLNWSDSGWWRYQLNTKGSPSSQKRMNFLNRWPNLCKGTSSRLICRWSADPSYLDRHCKLPARNLWLRNFAHPKLTSFSVLSPVESMDPKLRQQKILGNFGEPILLTRRDINRWTGYLILTNSKRPLGERLFFLSFLWCTLLCKL